jgi:release factor glutamine methyltransferase
MTVRQALRDCRLPEREKRALLAHALGVARERLIAHPESSVDPEALAQFAQLAGARLAGTPMAYLLGVQEFYGHALMVTPAVLIPRPDTEVLVECALEALGKQRHARVLDLGTGSGCIAIALARARPSWTVVATDRSAAALQVARQNSQRLGASIHLVAGDWFAPIQGRFDLVVSNPPYIGVQDAHLAELNCEPRLALTDEGDGMSALRSIIAGAWAHLEPDGHLLVEHGYDQAEATRALMRAHGLHTVRTYRDLAGNDRVCAGSRQAGDPDRAGGRPAAG